MEKRSHQITYEEFMNIGSMGELFLHSEYSDTEKDFSKGCQGFKFIQVLTKKGIFEIIFCAHIKSNKCASQEFKENASPECEIKASNVLVVNHGDLDFINNLDNIKNHLRRFIDGQK